jgi:DNA-binding transcriptional regulator LsrR (DeoR family)
MTNDEPPRTHADLTELRRLKVDIDELMKIVQLYFVERLSEKEIAERLKIHQSTVSRRLKDAFKYGLYTVTITGPRHHELQTTLEQVLKPFGVREVVIVHQGGGKNTKNLGPAGAELILRIIRSDMAAKSMIRVTMSCGETLRDVASHLIDRLARLPLDEPKRTIELYPAALYAGHHQQTIHPATLVTTIKIMVDRACPYTIEAFATNLQEGFYKWPTPDQKSYLVQSGIRKLMGNAGEADVFITGIGRVDDPGYESILEQLGVVRTPQQRQRLPAEIGFVPIDANGEMLHEVSEKLVGIGVRCLKTAAKSRDRSVIAIVGGEAKTAATLAAVKGGCINVLVTDETIGSYLYKELGQRATRVAPARPRSSDGRFPERPGRS